MNAERHFERLLKIEALLAAGSEATDGERAAAVAARDRARAAAAADGVDWRNPPKKETRRTRRWEPTPVDWSEVGRRVGKEVWERFERARKDAEAREHERQRQEQARRRREHHAAVRERSSSGAIATLEEAAREVAKARVMQQRDERRKFNDFVDSLG